MKTCSTCQTQNTDTARFCQGCSTPLVAELICSACGTVNAPTAHFCNHCGAPVRGTSTALTPLGGGTGRIPPNTMAGERYLILNKLGQGGFGAVYLVHDTRLGNKKCALKEMSTAALTTLQEKQQAEQAFQQEAHMLSVLVHPHIPRVTDYFSDGEKQFLVMDFVEGQTLEALLMGRSQPFPEAQVLIWAEQLCDALTYLHNRNPPIIFRDLKPGNIIVAPDGKTLYLIDFGIARLFKAGAGKDTMTLGTPGYAPPEQYGKGQTDARSDIYALGATLHQLLTLHDPSTILFKFPNARALNAHVSPAVDTALQRALALQADQRWGSVQELRAALRPVAPRARATPAPRVSRPATAAAFSPKASALPLPTPAPITPPVYTPPIPTTIPYADHGARLGAAVLDSVFLAIGSFVFSLPIIFLPTDDTIILLSNGLVLLWWFGYYTYPHARSGQTLGKKIGKIKVVRRNGDRLTLGRSLWRTFLFLVPPALISSLTIVFLLCPLGYLLYLWPLFEKEHRTLHDLGAGTWVIKT